MKFEYRAFCLLLEIAQTLYLYIGCARPFNLQTQTSFSFSCVYNFQVYSFHWVYLIFAIAKLFFVCTRTWDVWKYSSVAVCVCAGNCASTEYLLMPLPAIFINSATPTEWRKAFARYIFAHNIVLYLFAYVLCRIRCWTREYLSVYCMNANLAVKRFSYITCVAPRHEMRDIAKHANADFRQWEPTTEFLRIRLFVCGRCARYRSECVCVQSQQHDRHFSGEAYNSSHFIHRRFQHNFRTIWSISEKRSKVFFPIFFHRGISGTKWYAATRTNIRGTYDLIE